MLAPGKIIEYLENGKFICGLVTSAQDKKLHLLNQNGREVKLASSRVVHTGTATNSTDDTRENVIHLLKNTSNTRATLMREINLEELWELVSEEPTSNFSPTFLAELVFGDNVDDNSVSALLRTIFNDRLFFKYKEGQVRVNNKEKVEQLHFQIEKEKEKEKIITTGIELFKKIQDSDHEGFSYSEEDLLILEYIKDFYVFGKDSKTSDTAKKILEATGLKKDHAPFHFLVKARIFDKNENIPLLRYGLPKSFSLAARQQAERILQTPSDELFNDPGRKDLTHLKPITIDGATTLDFDDAITIEREENNYLVGIHISDVAHYVRPGDALFQEAMDRATSLYLPEGQIPMLPRHLSQGICSLIQGEIRAAFSFMILLSPEAEVKRVRIFPSIIQVARRLTYDEVDQMLDQDEELRLLDQIKSKLRKNRLEKGALLLPFPDVNIFVDQNTKVQIQLAKSDTPSRTLISELMILANTEAARYVSDRCCPGLFRAQGILKKRIVHGEDASLFQNLKQRKQLPRGELLTEAKPHSGLGANQYTTVTSPIRRLLDLVMQHQLNSIVRRQDLMFTQEMCKDFTSVITRVLANANNVKQQRHRYWIIKYLEVRVGQLVDALVIEAGPKRVFLVLTDCLLEFDLPTPHGKRPVPDTIVQVRIQSANALESSIKFSFN